MQLVFVNSGVIGSGDYPDFVQYPNTAGQLFYIDDGKLYGYITEEFQGQFDNPVFVETRKMTGDMAIGSLEMKTLAGYGIVGSYFVHNEHKEEYIHKLVLCNYDDLLEKVFND